jgi:hypothetical protein
MAKEIRWFFDGPLPGSVAEWFEKALPGEVVQPPEDERADAYLATGRAKDDDSGLKMRDVGAAPKFEFKWRTESMPFRADRMAGLLEDWGKKSWKFAGREGLQPVLDSIAGGLKMDWVTVTKRRRERRYELRHGELHPASGRVSEGFKIELTPFKSAGADWWSLGIDVCSDRDDVTPGLAKLAELLIRDYPGPALDIEHSFGYPAWVRRASA